MTSRNVNNEYQTENELEGFPDYGEEERAWLKRAKDAYLTSTDYMDAALRKEWERYVNIFRNQHSPGSKFLSEAYEKRHQIFRPKTRASIRKNEAAFAVAMFSTQDVLDVKPTNDKDKLQRISAAINKELLQYRLTKTIPWFLTSLGAFQDAQVYGLCISHQYWRFEERPVRKQESPREIKMMETPGYRDMDKGDFREDLDNSTADNFEIVEKFVDGDSPAENFIGEGQEEYEKDEETQGLGGAYEETDLASAATLGDETDELGFLRRTTEATEYETVYDEPVIDLIPPENFRFDPACDWRDPVNSSPYIIHIIPMFAHEVLERMESIDRKTGQPQWRAYTLGQLLSASREDYDSTRRAREGYERPDSQENDDYNEFSTIYVRQYILRLDGRDWIYYTVGSQILLSDPLPIEEIYLHGERPYAVGYCNFDAHRNWPDGLVALGSGLQEEINEVVNQRLDNVSLTLNKRYFIKRGQQVDLDALMKNVPGGGVMMDDPQRDVQVLDTPDVTRSSYEEQDRLNVEHDEIVGTFSQNSVQSNRQMNETVGGMNLLSSSANSVTEYTIRMFVETWVEKVLLQLIKLEQAYEADEVLLTIAAERVQMYQKLGDSADLDKVLRQDLTVNVNVGIGATNPFQKVERLVYGLNAVMNLPNVAQTINSPEIIAEVFGALGYKDGSRFFTPDEDDPQQDPLSLVPPEQLEQLVQQTLEGQKLQLEAQKLQVQQQIEMQKQELESQKVQLQAEMEMAKLAAQENLTLHELQAKIGIEQEKIKTERDVTALKESNRINELNFKAISGREGI